MYLFMTLISNVYLQFQISLFAKFQFSEFTALLDIRNDNGNIGLKCNSLQMNFLVSTHPPVLTTEL